MNPSSDFVKQLIETIFNSLQTGIVWAIKFIWDLTTSFLLNHWVIVIITLFVVLVYAVFKALMGQRWLLGHVLYNYFYWGLILLIGIIFGPEIFAGTYVEIFTFILYIICYIVVGRILTKIKLL